MPKIGDTWRPSKGPQLTDHAMKALHDLEREAEREKNKLKNENRKKSKTFQKALPKKRAEAGKQLRHAFGGAFGRAPSNVKFMAAQGTTMDTSEIPRVEGWGNDRVDEGETE